MNTQIGLALAALAISIAAGPGAQAAPDACAAWAANADTAAQPRANTAAATADASVGANHIGGEANPVTPTRTTQLAGSVLCLPN